MIRTPEQIAAIPSDEYFEISIKDLVDYASDIGCSAIFNSPTVIRCNEVAAWLELKQARIESVRDTLREIIASPGLNDKRKTLVERTDGEMVNSLAETSALASSLRDHHAHHDPADKEDIYQSVVRKSFMKIPWDQRTHINNSSRFVARTVAALSDEHKIMIYSNYADKMERLEAECADMCARIWFPHGLKITDFECRFNRDIPEDFWQELENERHTGLPEMEPVASDSDDDQVPVIEPVSGDEEEAEEVPATPDNNQAWVDRFNAAVNAEVPVTPDDVDAVTDEDGAIHVEFKPTLKRQTTDAEDNPPAKTAKTSQKQASEFSKLDWDPSDLDEDPPVKAQKRESTDLTKRLMEELDNLLE